VIQQDQWPPTVLVLAAGQGSRFKASGGSVDKLDALLHGQSVRSHVLAAVHASGLPHHVVERHHLAGIPDAGMGDSIACGVTATPHANGWLILPADLPLIQPATLLEVAHALRAHAIVVPFFNQTRGHPVAFQACFRDELMRLTGDVGARRIVSQRVFHPLNVNDQGVVLDVDTVELLDAAHRALQHREA
jgi:molybdenum cofactor cytidylyltransferase